MSDSDDDTENTPTTPRLNRARSSSITIQSISGEDKPASNASTSPSYYAPGCRAFKCSQLTDAHPFIPLLQCFAGLFPIANLVTIRSGSQAWGVNKVLSHPLHLLIHLPPPQTQNSNWVSVRANSRKPFFGWLRCNGTTNTCPSHSISTSITL